MTEQNSSLGKNVIYWLQYWSSSEESFYSNPMPTFLVIKGRYHAMSVCIQETNACIYVGPECWLSMDILQGNTWSLQAGLHMLLTELYFHVSNVQCRNDGGELVGICLSMCVYLLVGSVRQLGCQEGIDGGYRAQGLAGVVDLRDSRVWIDVWL